LAARGFGRVSGKQEGRVVEHRALDESDRTGIRGFLEKHRDTSMFLRSNLARSGVSYRPEPFHANWMGACRGPEIVAVVAHCWNGMLLLQAPHSAGELARACVESSGRAVTGFSGPLDQVREARIALDLTNAPAAMEADETLYGLDIPELVIPEILKSGAVSARPPLPQERGLLREWRFAYDIETLGSPESPETRDRSTRALDLQIAEGNAWVAVEHGRPVSLSAFNAALPDIVQLGGIYTPPQLRGRGYAKAAVAASLLAARDRGVTRAVLFTSNPSAARSYEALGFQRLGDFGLVILEQGS
jgi:GNAT superfamily N-acetyltransferase